jgi:hypothetical protein
MTRTQVEPPAQGFYPQPNDWTCGPFALKHALVALGRTVDANHIASTARTHWWSGTDEIRLARAAREFECDLMLERRRDAEQARKLLVTYLRQQTPVLLCVEEWTHWITVVRAEGTRFVIIDSNQDPVLSVATWPQLQKRWRYHDTDYDKKDPPILYDLMAVVPRFRSAVKADFSVERVKFLRRPENKYLALHWNEYLEDLLAICRPPSARVVSPLSMGEFLRRHQELVVSRVVFWHGGVGREEVLRVLSYLRFVSETYGLVIPASAARRAVADLAILIALWAAASRGVDKMYGVAARDKATNGHARGLGANGRANGRGSRRRAMRRAVAAKRRVAGRR